MGQVVIVVLVISVTYAVLALEVDVATEPTAEDELAGVKAGPEGAMTAQEGTAVTKAPLFGMSAAQMPMK